MTKQKKGVDHVTDKDFDEKIKSNLAIIDFYAEWCMPCLMMSPIVEELAEKFHGKVNFGKVNVDASPALASKFGVMSIPTFIFFKDGEEIQRFTGSLTEEQFTEKIETFL